MYNSKTTDVVKGVLSRLPWSGGLFLAGFIAVTGSPPFSPFISEYTIISSAFIDGRYWIGGFFLLFLALIFIGMAMTVLPMIMGAPPEEIESTGYHDRLLTVGPPLVMLCVIFWLGIRPPAFLVAMLLDGAVLLGGMP